MDIPENKEEMERKPNELVLDDDDDLDLEEDDDDEDVTEEEAERADGA